MQKGMLYHYMIDKSTNEYIEQMRIHIKSRHLDIDIFENSVNMIIERHDALRSVFIYENVDHPRQVVLKEKSIKVKFFDLSTLQEEEKQRILNSHSADEITQGFDLSQDALMRVSIFKIKMNIKYFGHFTIL